jgi:uncharacterized coiled-coil protein SlyX
VNYRTAAYKGEYEPEPEKRTSLSWILVFSVILAVTGSGAAFAWRAHSGKPVFSLNSAAPTTPVVASKPAEQGDLEALRQQIAGSVQLTEKLLTAQQAEIKRLSDQLTLLTNKLDLLQGPVARAQAAIPRPPAGTTNPEKPDAAKPNAEIRSAPKSSDHHGAISTGGAPLQLNR